MHYEKGSGHQQHSASASHRIRHVENKQILGVDATLRERNLRHTHHVRVRWPRAARGNLLEGLHEDDPGAVVGDDVLGVALEHAEHARLRCEPHCVRAHGNDILARRRHAVAQQRWDRGKPNA